MQILKILLHAFLSANYHCINNFFNWKLRSNSLEKDSSEIRKIYTKKLLTMIIEKLWSSSNKHSRKEI